jgi:hypothetical protein
MLARFAAHVYTLSYGEAPGALEELGLITNTRAHIHILDRAGLEKYSCECYKVVRDEFDRLLGV